ncbi:MAG: GNAT family N-acetyltransferase [Spirochaetales bacterium]|nr:GNAT family N-acetyltransferase [Spirochaetales bacterium]
MAASLDGLYRVQKQDLGKVTATLVDAFSDDPLWNAIFPDYPNEFRRVSAVYEVPIRYCLKYGSVYADSDRLEGVASWVPGEYSNMAMHRMLASGAMKSATKIGFKFARKMMPILKPIEEDRRKNMADVNHIYLQTLGVARAYQGRGVGGSLLRALIGESERTGRFLYLETETEKNAAMYESFGFKLIRKIILPVVDLPMWEMARNP